MFAKSISTGVIIENKVFGPSHEEPPSLSSFVQPKLVKRKSKTAAIMLSAGLASEDGNTKLPRKSRKGKNYIGMYVKVIAGKHAGMVCFVIKGKNGYFSVQNSFPSNAKADTVFMKRSSHLRALTEAEMIEFNLNNTARPAVITNGDDFAEDMANYEDEEMESASSSSPYPPMEAGSVPASSVTLLPFVPIAPVKQKRKTKVKPTAVLPDINITMLPSTSFHFSEQQLQSPPPAKKRMLSKSKQASLQVSLPSGGSVESSLTEGDIATAMSAGDSSTISEANTPRGKTKPRSYSKVDCIGRRVRILHGKFKDQTGLVERSGHGFFAVSLADGLEVMRRGQELELIDDPTGLTLATTRSTSPSTSPALAPVLALGTMESIVTKSPPLKAERDCSTPIMTTADAMFSPIQSVSVRGGYAPSPFCLDRRSSIVDDADDCASLDSASSSYASTPSPPQEQALLSRRMYWPAVASTDGISSTSLAAVDGGDKIGVSGSSRVFRTLESEFHGQGSGTLLGGYNTVVNVSATSSEFTPVISVPNRQLSDSSLPDLSRSSTPPNTNSDSPRSISSPFFHPSFISSRRLDYSQGGEVEATHALTGKSPSQLVQPAQPAFEFIKNEEPPPLFSHAVETYW